MAKAPKTVEGLRTALIALLPPVIDSQCVTLMVHYHDSASPCSQRSYVSYHAHFEVHYGEVEFKANAEGPTPAKLLLAAQRELRIAARRAEQQRELTHAAPRLEHSRN